MPLSQSSMEYITRSGSSRPRELHRMNAAAASENKAIETLVSSGFSMSIFKSHRTFVLVRSHTNPKTLAGRPLSVASFAIVAAVRMVAKPPAQPIPLRSRRWASGRMPSFWFTRRSYPGLPALVLLEATVWLMSCRSAAPFCNSLTAGFDDEVDSTGAENVIKVRNSGGFRTIE